MVGLTLPDAESSCPRAADRSRCWVFGSTDFKPQNMLLLLGRGEFQMISEGGFSHDA